MTLDRDRAWACSVALFTGLLLLIGGSSLPSHIAMMSISIASLSLLCFGLWRLRLRSFSRIESFSFAIAVLGIGLMLAQLLPIPPDTWFSLGGRDFISPYFQTAGVSPQWLPLSLSAEMTKQDLLAVLPGLAGFIAVLSLAREDWLKIAFVFVAVTLLSVLFGLLQKFQSFNGLFDFYGHQGGALSTGFFVNPNFYAAQLFCAIPFIVALTVREIKRPRLPVAASGLIGFAAITLVIAGLGATASRAGVLMAMLVVVLSLVLIAQQFPLRRLGVVSPYGGLVICVVLGLFILFATGGLLRLSNTDPVTDYRTVISAVSFQTLQNFLPLGSGFGSFVPAYQLFEAPATLQSHYVNHAHNDWMELIIEGGLPMALVMLGFIIWFGVAAFTVWRNKNFDLTAKAASISACALLLHSFVDYPLRTPALMMLFSMCCGFIARDAKPHIKKHIRVVENVALAPNIISFRPRSQGFAR
jgi:O-antigen ligase